MMHITEDTPPDMLAGAMDLAVSLPDGRDVKMAVERSTPMMDLLVQVTTAYKLRPSDHLLQALNMSGGSHNDRVLPYKPNTPIGALDTQNIRVLPKGRSLPMPKSIAPGHQPFESTFRLQVHLPMNQFCVIRVGKHCMLEDIMRRVCEEKNLDPRKFEFRHPANIDQVLDPKRTLSDYEITEITVVPRGSGRMPPTLSSGDIMALQREEERKKMLAKTGGGVLNLIFRRGRNNMGSGSISSDTRSISPTQSDDSRSVTPPAVQPSQILPAIPQEQNRPKPPQRKRRPAPKPPQTTAPEPRNQQKESIIVQESRHQQETNLENGLTICHSRNSSDSSGYHEASILSVNCNTSLPRPKTSVVNSCSGDSALGMEKSADFSKSTGNLSNMIGQSKSTMSLTNAGRKKKAPPPPPVLKTTSSVASIPTATSTTTSTQPMAPVTHTAPVVSVAVDSQSTPLEVELTDSSISPTSNSSSPRITASSLISPSPLAVTVKEILPLSDTTTNEDITHIADPPSTFRTSESLATQAPIESFVELVAPSPSIDAVENDDLILQVPKKLNLQKLETENLNELEAEWQYQLPSPPQAFRDSSPTNFTDMTNYDTVTFNGLPSESVVTPPPLFDKESVRDNHSESGTIGEVDTTEPEVLTSKYLSLENLEKRKSLVLEREIASLKNTQNGVSEKKEDVEDTLRNQRNSLLSEIEEVIQHSNKNGRTALSRTNSQSREKILQAATDSTLSNFKITTYDQPKSKINIFEDDSIRSSNVENKISDSQKRNSIADMNVSFKAKNYENEIFLANKRNSLCSASTENVSFMKRLSNADDELFKKPQDVPKYNKFSSLVTNGLGGDAVSRSESFSNKNVWSKSSPVKRSKSQVSLDKYKDLNINTSAEEDSLQKSNSMWNVSGLQSLEVMRMILPKLGNTPPSSPQAVKPPIELQKPVLEAPEMLAPQIPATQLEPVKESPRKYQYRGPPSINLGTWSERPKSQISLKEDKDYKISNTGASKAKFSSQINLNNEPTKSNQQENVSSVNIRVNGLESKDQVDSGKINIKINSEPSKAFSHQSAGNVIIKIGNMNTPVPATKPEDKNFYSRFLNQTTAVGYRKPLGNINGVDKPRPHSIAFDASCPDLSRVPIVRSVELKKSFKETQNKSITQIKPDDLNELDGTVRVINGDEPRNFDGQEVKSTTLGNKFSNIYVSSENINSNNKTNNMFSKPVSRVSSFAFTRPANNVPIVKGFRLPQNTESLVENSNKTNWNNNQEYGTLSPKPIVTQNNIPFSQNHLKRTSNIFTKFDKFSNTVNSSPIEKVVLRSTANRSAQLNRNSTGSCYNIVGLPNGNTPTIPVPPIPPQLPKITSVTKKNPMQMDADPRDQLLDAIRNFGRKSGLKTVK